MFLPSDAVIVIICDPNSAMETGVTVNVVIPLDVLVEYVHIGLVCE